MAKRKSDAASTAILRFSEDHLWVRVDADRGQIGLSDFGQALIGEVIGIELPDVGDALARGETFGQVESTRALQELVAPVNGTVVAVNGDLEDHPTLANEDPYREGWLIEIELEDEDELDDLMGADDYEDLVATEKN